MSKAQCLLTHSNQIMLITRIVQTVVLCFNVLLPTLLSVEQKVTLEIP